MSHHYSVAILVFCALASASIGAPVSDWKTKCGLNPDAIEQSKAVIGAKMDDIKLIVQDWAREEVEGIMVSLTTRYSVLSVTHELQKSGAKILSFLAKQKSLGLLSQEDMTTLRRAVDKEAGEHVRQIEKSLSELTEILKVNELPADLKLSDERIATTFDNYKKTVLEAADKLFASATSILSKKFDV
ncbi:hypothetical protein HDE_01029 [Halotydeus destructor]|nr:hypothetical protein HDE_01029 [Halotydeus destructor]